MINRLNKLDEKFSDDFNNELIFIDDGSNDNSLEILKEYSKSNKLFKIISFSRNFGHQIAVTAGINKSTGNFISIIDADLQDPPELIPQMYRIAKKNNLEVVYGKRVKRPGETYFKKITASLFYRFLNFMTDFEIPKDTGDFRLITRKVADIFNKMPEKHRFIRGMIPWLGFKSLPLDYERDIRRYGNSKFSLKKMIKFANNAILSFSSQPIILASKFGIFLILSGMFFGSYVLYLKLFKGITAGITSIILVIIILGGFQIYFIGIIGRYIGKVFEESKKRPLYIINEEINF